MKISMMQPYLFPYIGYFQLINLSDYFGIANDVQFIKRGWINRNRILQNSESNIFSFSVKKDSFQKNIKERYFTDNFNNEKKYFFKRLKQNYIQAPFYTETIQFLDFVFEFKETNISKFNENQLKLICNYLEINTIFINPSLMIFDKNIGKNAEDRVIKRLKKLDKLEIKQFINPIGGKELYHKDFFKKNNFELIFIKPNEISYKQFNNNFISNLSIIDVMMFNSVGKIKDMLNEYTLI